VLWGEKAGGGGAKSERERALLAQIKQLEGQLAKEKHKKKEAAKAVAPSETRKRLVVCTQWLPYQVERTASGELRVLPSPARYVAGYATIKRLDVQWVGVLYNVTLSAEEQPVARRLLEPFSCFPVFIEEEQLHFAEEIAAEVLWPLFHYIPLSMLDADIDMVHKRWEGYTALNTRFRDTVLELAPLHTDLVWVHDYYLMLLPQMLREARPKMRIGWFLHTPFPSAEIYHTLPHRKTILRGVLGANLIGFQIYDYVRHFMTACASVLGTDVNVESTYILDAQQRTAVTVDAFPVGIDCAHFQSLLATRELKDKVIELQRRFDGKKIVLGIDRMDYIKGIPHKLLAIDKFLSAHPSWAGKIQLVQIATPIMRGDTARYVKLRNKVHKLVGQINGRFSTLAHAPIHYLDQPISPCDVAALCFLADVMMITSLREGMNANAFEYVACQQRNRGVLILSEFAGSAQTLGSGAILVNPFNTDAMALALYEALHMPEADREERHHNMNEYVQRFTLQYWSDDFSTELMTQEDADHELLSLELPEPLPRSELLDSFAKSSRRLILLGLLGTLINYSDFKEMHPLSDKLWGDLLTLASDPGNCVVVITGRERGLVSQWLGDLPVWVVAENGVFVRLGGPSTEWACPLEPVEPNNDWKASIKPVLKYFEERTPGSITESQEHTLTWHYRDSDEDFGEIQASDLQLHLKEVLGNQPVEVFLDSKMVQLRPYGVSKGAALEAVLEACTLGPRDLASVPSTRRERTDDTTARLERESNTSSLHELSEDLATAAAAAEAPLTQEALAAAAGAAERLPLDFVLCLGAHSMRDEDLFGGLLPKEGEDREEYMEHLPADAKHVWTCRVGRQPSQARHYVDDEREAAALLAQLGAATRIGQEKEREQAAVQLQLDEAAAASIDGDAVGERAAAAADEQSLRSALECMDEIEEQISGFQLAFFLDYDGTLTPIVENPSEAKLSEEARSVVRALSYRFPTAIVSGRARATAQGLMQLDGLYYAGSHGFDILGPDGSNYKMAESFRPSLEEAKVKLEEQLAHIAGALVEDNNFSVSAHYRMVAEEEREAVNEAVERIVAEMPMLRRTYGKMVYELRPSAEWDKGKAVEWLIENWIKRSCELPVFPIYIGDDVTDEDAFRVMGGLGGFGIIVSDFPRLITDTAASYALRSPLEVLHFLDHFAFSSPSAPPSERISALVAGGSAAESESEASPFVERRTPAERYSER